MYLDRTHAGGKILQNVPLAGRRSFQQALLQMKEDNLNCSPIGRWCSPELGTFGIF